MPYAALFDAEGEITGAGYARKLLALGIISGRTSNLDPLTWGVLPESWDTITAIKIFAELTGGDPLHAGPLKQPVATQAGRRYRIVKGAIMFPEAIPDTALFDEVLFDDAGLGYDLLPVELLEILLPPPAAFNIRVSQGARRAI